jgi:diguanylate cyclase (GGDEF)-like protein
MRTAAAGFWLVMAAIVASAYVQPGPAVNYAGLWVIAGLACLGGITTWFIPWPRIPTESFLWVVLPGAVVLTLAVFFTGGVHSHLLIVYPLLIAFGATVLDVRRSLLLALVGAIGAALPLVLQGWDPAYARQLLVLTAVVGFGGYLPARVRIALTEETELAESRRRDLEQSYVSTIAALATALDAKDRYTEAHSRETAALALAVGRRLGLSGERLKFLEYAAYLHDIGKIGIPGHILHKPGPLSAEEFEIMKEHPVIGERIVGSVPFLAPVRSIVRAEHERFDGTGYPDGLAASEIPLESRIILACDAFHAMATDRPYRNALPKTQILDELRTQSGKQFDPTVVTALLAVIQSEEVLVSAHSKDAKAIAPAATSTGPRSWAQQLEAIEGLGRRLTRGAAVQEICQLIGETIVALVPYDQCRAYLVDRDERMLSCVYFTASELDDYRGVTAPSLAVRIGEGITGWVADTKRGLVLGDAERHPKAEHVPGTPVSDESMLAVPVVFEERLIGVIVVVKVGLQQYSPDHLRLLTILANQAAVSIAHARLTELHAETSMLDPVSGVGYRREFEAALARHVEAAVPFSLLMLRLDNLADVNQVAGLSAGDALLKSVGDVIRQNLASGYLAARWAGREFVILMPRCDEFDARAFSKRILSALPRAQAGTAAPLLSVGVGEYPLDGTSAEELVTATRRSVLQIRRRPAA